MAVRRYVRRLVPPALLAASLGAFVASGLYSEGGNGQRPAVTVNTPPNYYASNHCADLREGCTIGRTPQPSQRLVWVQECSVSEDGATRRVPCPRSGSTIGGSTYHP